MYFSKFGYNQALLTANRKFPLTLVLIQAKPVMELGATAFRLDALSIYFTLTRNFLQKTV